MIGDTVLMADMERRTPFMDTSRGGRVNAEGSLSLDFNFRSRGFVDCRVFEKAKEELEMEALYESRVSDQNIIWAFESFDFARVPMIGAYLLLELSIEDLEDQTRLDSRRQHRQRK